MSMCFCGSVVEHCVSSEKKKKGCGFNSQGGHTDKKYIYLLPECIVNRFGLKRLLNVKCINVT